MTSAAASNAAAFANPRFSARKCSATGRLITPKDHSCVQVAIAEVNAAGVATGQTKTFVLSGFVRKDAEADDSLNRLAQSAGLLKNVWSAQL